MIYSQGVQTHFCSIGFEAKVTGNAKTYQIQTQIAVTATTWLCLSCSLWTYLNHTSQSHHQHQIKSVFKLFTTLNIVALMIFFFISPLGGIIPRFSSVPVNIHAPGNSNPQFLQKVYRGTVAEEQDPGVPIVKVSLRCFKFSSRSQI